ncbi:MAG: DUF4258 domain-containing protein [Candidatus Cloacimonetes bacterium]|nr:DUF4258 domain-containing protein [Candidatus Cloacimonadota bacterium]
MPRQVINKIRDALRTGNYDMTHHAIEEMSEDRLRIFDVESAIFNGKIIKREKEDPRGIKYIIKGVGSDQSTPVGVVGRFKETGVFLIITVYKIT